MRTKKKQPTAVQNRASLAKMDKIADKFGLWRPGLDVLHAVRGVPTDFVQLDEATRIGAWPTERVCTVTGPSNEGKTALLLGIGLSFLKRGHFFGLIDAEMTTPEAWVRELMGEYAKSPRFLALRPNTYEDATEAARQFARFVTDARAETGETDLTGFFAVDSMRKLVPKNLMANILKSAGGEDEAPKRGQRRGAPPKGIDGAGGRAAQMKAALNAQWLDELIPLANRSGISVALIAREIGDEDEHDPFKKFELKMGSGRALMYDSSLLVRVTRAKALYLQTEPPQYIGERHEVTIWKTKIAKKDRQRPVGYFHTINGTLEGTKAGFDRPRDIIDLAKRKEVITVNGSWFSFGKKRIGQGEESAIKRLWADPALLDEIEAACRAKFDLEGEASDAG